MVIVGDEKNSLAKEVRLKMSGTSDLVAWDNKLLRLSARSAHFIQGEGG